MQVPAVPLFRGQGVRTALADRPRHLTGPVRLRDGSSASVRFIRPADTPRLIEFFASLSPETVRRRFFHLLRELPLAEAARFAHVDGSRRDALVAWVASPDGSRPIVAVARYDQQDEQAAEVALVVADAYQGRGLGSALLHRLIALLQQRGLFQLRGHVLAGNERIVRLLRSTGYPLTIATEADLRRIELDLAISPAERPGLDKRCIYMHNAFRYIDGPPTGGPPGGSEMPTATAAQNARTIVDETKVLADETIDATRQVYQACSASCLALLEAGFQATNRLFEINRVMLDQAEAANRETKGSLESLAAQGKSWQNTILDLSRENGRIVEHAWLGLYRTNHKA